MEKNTSEAALRGCALHDGSGTGHRSCTYKRHSLLKVRHDKNRGRCRWQREKKFRAQLGSQRGNLKCPVWKYFGFWSVDSKDAEPRDKVVCKLRKLQLAYHSTTSNMRAHLKNMHPNEHAMMPGTPTNSHISTVHFSLPATSSLSAALQEAFICKDMRPISIIDSTSFREFCQELEPRYRILKQPIQVVMSW